mgnify:CR=1 FL=1
MKSAKYRDLKFGVTRVKVRREASGIQYIEAEQELGKYPERMTDRLIHWATVKPNETLFARRVKNADGTSGDWQRVTYSQALTYGKHIAQGLINRGLSQERPVLILSENDIEHALMGLGCMIAGVPYCPASPAYSTISQDYEKLRHILNTLTPGLVFAADSHRYAKAIQTAVDSNVEVILNHGTVESHKNSSFSDLLATPITSKVDAAIHATTPDTIVKFLFTSGSTKLPKAVINTQRMWCATTCIN